MNRRPIVPLLLAGLVACAAAARAADPWDPSDDAANTQNLLRHGVVQAGHELGGPGTADTDWMRVVTRTRHSYEARVTGFVWNPVSCTASGCGGSFDRVSAAGAVLTAGDAAGGDPTASGGRSLGRTVRWVAAAGGAEYLRAARPASSTVPVHPYDVVFYDTTLFVPRWNNTSTQATVLLLQNATDVAVAGFVYFYSDAGSLLATADLAVPPRGLQVLPVASIPELAGQAGSATVAHLGGYAALTGKAVALEPATGFTFDTTIAPLAR